jgi:hypothetical protein
LVVVVASLGFLLSCCVEETCQWTKVDAIFGPAPRKLHKVVVYNDSIYIIGGIDSSGKSLNDVWFYEAGKLFLFALYFSFAL